MAFIEVGSTWINLAAVRSMRNGTGELIVRYLNGEFEAIKHALSPGMIAIRIDQATKG